MYTLVWVSGSDNEQLFGLDWVSADNPKSYTVRTYPRRIDLQELLMDPDLQYGTAINVQLRRLQASYERIKHNTDPL